MTKADSPAKPPPKRLETITLKVFIHCEGCRRKVRRIIRVLDGVEDVTVDPTIGKVTVTGNVDAKAILQRLQKYGKHAEMWPSSAPIPTPPAPAAPTGKAGTNPPKPQNNNSNSENNNKKNGNAGADGGDKATVPATENGSKKGDGKEAKPGSPAKGGVVNETKPENGKKVKPEEANNASPPTQNGGGGGGGGGGGKKGGKKGGNATNTSSNGSNNNISGGGNANAPEVALPPPRIHDIPIMGPPNTSIEISANRSLTPYDSVQTGYAYHSAEYATHMFSDENANNCSIM